MKIFKCNGLSIKMLVYNTILVSILLTVFYGCAQENPLLYDTTRRDSSVSIRFINMSNDGVPRLFSMDGTFGFSQIQYHIKMTSHEHQCRYQSLQMGIYTT